MVYRLTHKKKKKKIRDGQETTMSLSCTWLGVPVLLVQKINRIKQHPSVEEEERWVKEFLKAKSSFAILIHNLPLNKKKGRRTSSPSNNKERKFASFCHPITWWWSTCDQRFNRQLLFLILFTTQANLLPCTIKQHVALFCNSISGSCSTKSSTSVLYSDLDGGVPKWWAECSNRALPTGLII